MTIGRSYNNFKSCSHERGDNHFQICYSEFLNMAEKGAMWKGLRRFEKQREHYGENGFCPRVTCPVWRRCTIGMHESQRNHNITFL